MRAKATALASPPDAAACGRAALTGRAASCGWTRAGPPSAELPPPTAYSARALLARLWHTPRLAVRLCGATVEARPVLDELRADSASEVALTAREVARQPMACARATETEARAAPK